MARNTLRRRKQKTKRLFSAKSASSGQFGHFAVHTSPTVGRNAVMGRLESLAFSVERMYHEEIEDINRFAESAKRIKRLITSK